MAQIKPESMVQTCSKLFFSPCDAKDNVISVTFPILQLAVQQKLPPL